MDNTAIQAGSPPSTAGSSTAFQAAPPSPVVPARGPRQPKSLGLRVLEPLADLRITVVLFVLSLFLVFYGTLAQQDRGTWTAVTQYFRSFYVFIPADIVFIKPIIRFEGHIPGYLPYPGGWLLGGALLINLLAAHVVRFKATWKRPARACRGRFIGPEAGPRGGRAAPVAAPAGLDSRPPASVRH